MKPSRYAIMQSPVVPAVWLDDTSLILARSIRLIALDPGGAFTDRFIIAIPPDQGWVLANRQAGVCLHLPTRQTARVIRIRKGGAIADLSRIRRWWWI